jgi:hypothetical protein
VRVPDGVGQRLLNDPVCGEVHARSQLAGGTDDLEIDGQSRPADLFEYAADLVQ